MNPTVTTSLFCVVFLVVAASSAGPLFVDAAEGNKLLLVMLDGFRWDYLDTFSKGQLPAFYKIQEYGVRAKSLQPEFPSLSFVNYYSLMTGLHPENHGIIHDYLYDPASGRKFQNGGENPQDLDAFWWEGSEPIWITAEKQNKSCRFWDSAQNPSPFNFSQALVSAIEVLRNGSADIAGVHFEQLNRYGQDLSPEDVEIANLTQNIDKELVGALNLLKSTSFSSTEKKHLDKVNLMIFSDHGMTEVANNGIIHLNYSVFQSTDNIVGSKFGPVVQIYESADRVNLVYDRLKNFHRNMTVYRKDEIPDRWHLKEHPRVPSMLLVADKGYAIANQAFDNTWNGFYGYDNEIKDMHGIFLAIGPNFHKGKRVKTLRSVDLYQIMCRILKIEPAPNNGNWTDVADFFVESSGHSSVALFRSPVSSLLLMILVTALATCRGVV